MSSKVPTSSCFRISRASIRMAVLRSLAASSRSSDGERRRSGRLPAMGLLPIQANEGSTPGQRAKNPFYFQWKTPDGARLTPPPVREGLARQPFGEVDDGRD